MNLTAYNLNSVSWIGIWQTADIGSDSFPCHIEQSAGTDIQAVTEGKRFRIVGDNVNFMVAASHQRKGNSTHMEHWFASAAIIQNNSFDHLPCNFPQMPLLDLSPQSFLPSDNDFKVITNDYIYIVFQILTRHLTFLKKFKPFTAELKMTYGQRTVIWAPRVPW